MGEISRSGTSGTKGVCFCNSDRHIDVAQLYSREFCQFTLLLAKNVLVHSNSHLLVFPLSHIISQGPVRKKSYRSGFSTEEILKGGLGMQVVEELKSNMG